MGKRKLEEIAWIEGEFRRVSNNEPVVAEPKGPPTHIYAPKKEKDKNRYAAFALKQHLIEYHEGLDDVNAFCYGHIAMINAAWSCGLQFYKI